MITAHIGVERVDRCLLAADLHLAGDEAPRERLRQLLALSRGENAPLFLLGDVFHYWFGRRHLSLPTVRREVHLLRAATALGPPITIIPGNRDFLLDAAFTAETGVRIAPDTLVIEVAGERIHLSHGDLFGLADVRYQRMRRVLRSAPVRWCARSLPTGVVDAIARRLRRHSETVVQSKSAETLAPDRQAVLAVLRTAIDVVVCGHFHQASDERFSYADGGGRFRILEPFEERGYVLSAGPEGWRERRLAEATAP